MPSQLGNIGGQTCFIVSALQDFALRRTMLAECHTGGPLGNRQRSANMLDTGTATRGAQ